MKNNQSASKRGGGEKRGESIRSEKWCGSPKNDPGRSSHHRGGNAGNTSRLYEKGEKGLNLPFLREERKTMQAGMKCKGDGEDAKRTEPFQISGNSCCSKGEGGRFRGCKLEISESWGGDEGRQRTKSQQKGGEP